MGNRRTAPSRLYHTRAWKAHLAYGGKLSRPQLENMVLNLYPAQLSAEQAGHVAAMLGQPTQLTCVRADKTRPALDWHWSRK